MNYICDIEIGINEHDSKVYFYQEGESRPVEPTSVTEFSAMVRAQKANQQDIKVGLENNKSNTSANTTITYTITPRTNVAQAFNISPSCETTNQIPGITE